MTMTRVAARLKMKRMKKVRAGRPRSRLSSRTSTRIGPVTMESLRRKMKSDYLD